MLKKITAIISAIAVFVGSLSVPTLLSQAANYTGKLTIEGAAAVSNDSTWFYMEGTDEYSTGSDNWPELTMMPEANDTESGIFVDGVRINDYFSAGENPTSVRSSAIPERIITLNAYQMLRLVVW